VGAKDVIFAMPSWIMVQRTEEFRMQKVVTMLASAPGPALCETPILCYWAGKKFEVDPFNFMEGVAAGIKNEDTVLERLRSSYYGIVQVFSPDTTSHFSPRFFSVLRSHYAPVASPLNSVELFVPR
jgi:hypothetical protein